MDHADGHVVGLGVVADLPDLGHVLERCDEALARRGVVHSRDARGLRAVLVQHLVHLEQVQIGVEQHQRVRQVVGHGHVLAIARDRQVARVDARAHLGHHLQVPDVELGDPAVARREEHIASIGREFRPAVQRKARSEAVDGFELVTIEHGDMVVPGFHHDEEVHHVHALEHRRGLVGQAARCMLDDARGLDVGLGHGRCGYHGGVNVLCQRGNLCLGELTSEAGHLCGGAAFADHLQGFGLAQARETLGQQRRGRLAEPTGAMAGGAVLLEKRGGGFGMRGHAGGQQQGGGAQPSAYSGQGGGRADGRKGAEQGVHGWTVDVSAPQAHGAHHADSSGALVPIWCRRCGRPHRPGRAGCSRGRSVRGRWLRCRSARRGGLFAAWRCLRARPADRQT